MGILKWLKEALTPTKRESGQDYDGPLSTYVEWHSFEHGLYDGMAGSGLRPPKELPDIVDVQREPHYYKVGWVIGGLISLPFPKRNNQERS